MENRRTRSVHSRDRYWPSDGRPGGPDDLRHARLDALDLDKRGKPCSARTRLALIRGWGFGYATEAAAAIRDWAYKSRCIDLLVSLISPNNVRSQRVAERLGATPTETVTPAHTKQKTVVWKTYARCLRQKRTPPGSGCTRSLCSGVIPEHWRRRAQGSPALAGEEAELAEEVHLVEEQVLRLQRVALGDVNRRPPERKGSSCRLDIAVGGVEDTIMGADHDPFRRCGRPVGEEMLDLEAEVRERFLEHGDETDDIVAAAELAALRLSLGVPSSQK